MKLLIIGVRNPVGGLFERNLRKAGLTPRDYYTGTRYIRNYANNRSSQEDLYHLFYEEKAEKDIILSILADACQQYKFEPTIHETTINTVKLPEPEGR